MEQALHAEAERRQLTVMFCDLVDSTRLSARVDPEDLREIVRGYQECTAYLVERFGGHIAQYLGDGVLIYFGYPQAHEDDALRAVRSALEILSSMTEVSAKMAARHQVSLAVRVSIHTGPVVVGEMGGGRRREDLALGETPNIAARIQTIAQPDTVVISEATWRIVRGYFEVEEQGVHALKGLARPIAVYRVCGESGAESRLDLSAKTDLTRLVGREAEWHLLLERWAQSKEGFGQIVLLSGEAGIGKSRLAETLGSHILSDAGSRLTFRCSSYHINSALHPIIVHLERVLQFERGDASNTKLSKLENTLATYRFANDKTVAHIASLLAIPIPEDRYPLHHLSAPQQKQQTQHALIAWLIEEAERHPILMVWEDLHWADPSSMELLGLLIDHVPAARMLAVFTSRPEFEPPWAIRSYLTHITLNRLSRHQAEEMIAAITKGKRLPHEVVVQLIEKTDGVPLFIEELLKMVLESSLLREEETEYRLAVPLPALTIPTTLQDSLMSRIDRLVLAGEVARLGAVIGREFLDEIIHAVSTLEEQKLNHALRQLILAEVVYPRGLPGQVRYVFKHALIRDAAYQSLLKTRRRTYHQLIAQALEERIPETRETEPEVLAHHYTEAGMAAQAIGYWQCAGQRAIERSANLEAIAYLSRGLQLIPLLAEATKRAQTELSLQIALAVPLLATKGYAALEVERAYARARELSLQVGDNPEMPTILWGLWVFYLTCGPLELALQTAQQYQVLAERQQQASLLLETCQLLGNTLFYMGEFPQAIPYLERGSVMYDPTQHHALIFEHGGADTGVAIMTHHALTLWALGYPHRAQKAMDAALSAARMLAHPFSLAFAHYFCAWLCKFSRQDSVLYQSTCNAISICEEHGFPFWRLSSIALRCSTGFEKDNHNVVIAQMREAITSFEATGAQLFLSGLLGLLAEARGRIGRQEEGLAVIAEAFGAMKRSQEHWCHAELHRIRGELLIVLPGDHMKEGECALQEALAVARSQQALAWELRATISLSRLWKAQGRSDEAHVFLTDICARFTEGFDTADLQEARSLLAYLHPPPQPQPRSSQASGE